MILKYSNGNQYLLLICCYVSEPDAITIKYDPLRCVDLEGSYFLLLLSLSLSGVLKWRSVTFNDIRDFQHHLLISSFVFLIPFSGLSEFLFPFISRSSCRQHRAPVDHAKASRTVMGSFTGQYKAAIWTQPSSTRLTF